MFTDLKKTAACFAHSHQNEENTWTPFHFTFWALRKSQEAIRGFATQTEILIQSAVAIGGLLDLIYIRLQLLEAYAYYSGVD